MAEVPAAERPRGLGQPVDRPQRCRGQAASEQRCDGQRAEQRDQGHERLRAVEAAGRRQVAADLARRALDESPDTADRGVQMLLEHVLGVRGIVVRRADARPAVVKLASRGLPLALDCAQEIPLRPFVEGSRCVQRPIHSPRSRAVLHEIIALALLHVEAPGDPGRLQVLEQAHADRGLFGQFLRELLGPVRREQQQETTDQRADEHGREHRSGEHEQARWSEGRRRGAGDRSVSEDIRLPDHRHPQRLPVAREIL